MRRGILPQVGGNDGSQLFQIDAHFEEEKLECLIDETQVTRLGKFFSNASATRFLEHIPTSQVHFGAMIQEKLEDLNRLDLNGQTQRRIELTTLVTHTVGIDAVLQQLCDNFGLVCLDCCMYQGPVFKTGSHAGQRWTVFENELGAFRFALAFVDGTQEHFLTALPRMHRTTIMSQQ